MTATTHTVSRTGRRGLEALGVAVAALALGVVVLGALLVTRSGSPDHMLEDYQLKMSSDIQIGSTLGIRFRPTRSATISVAETPPGVSAIVLNDAGDGMKRLTVQVDESVEPGKYALALEILDGEDQFTLDWPFTVVE